GWAASRGSSVAMASDGWTSIRPGSTIAAASAVGRSSVGSRRLAASRGLRSDGAWPSPPTATPATASKSSRSCNSAPPGRLVPDLGWRQLVEPAEERVERAELADQLGGRLHADPRHAGDVVGRVALEGLVVDHLVGPQAEPLVDPRHVIHHGVLDAGPGGHE